MHILLVALAYGCLIYSQALLALFNLIDSLFGSRKSAKTREEIQEELEENERFFVQLQTYVLNEPTADEKPRSLEDSSNEVGSTQQGSIFNNLLSGYCDEALRNPIGVKTAGYIRF